MVPGSGLVKEQAEKVSPAVMSRLGQAIYFGELSGALAVLNKRGSYSAEGAEAMLIQQGLARKTAVEIWQAALAADE